MCQQNHRIHINCVLKQLLPPTSNVRGKVMFSQVSVSPQGNMYGWVEGIFMTVGAWLLGVCGVPDWGHPWLGVGLNIVCS